MLPLSLCVVFTATLLSSLVTEAGYGQTPGKPKRVYSERQLRLARYPCSDCHRLTGGTEDRKGSYHYDIDYQHFSNQGTNNCLVCHDSGDRNFLRLPASGGGSLVTFNESYRLCLSCHGDKKADYDAGIHGKDVGGWASAQQIRLQCVDCHNPHSPKIKPMVPLPPPVKPRTLIPKHSAHATHSASAKHTSAHKKSKAIDP